MLRRCFLACVLALAALGFSRAGAEEVSVCFNYGCFANAPVHLAPARLEVLLLALAQAKNEADERRRLAVVIGKLYAIAAEQSPVGSDRGGNHADDGVDGRMDCIDHATTTTRFLKLLEAKGGLKWHKVLAPERRLRFFVLQHYSAAIEELCRPQGDCRPQDRYAVDSWFVDNGETAVVLPLEAWHAGAGPDV
jgi:hypothetical protein